MENVEQIKRTMGVEWIRSSESGNTYLCPTGFSRRQSEVNEDVLKRHCIDESSNPQNN
jgi:hypothetical protein